MISYKPFWNTIKEHNSSTYKLIQWGILPDTIQRLRSGRPISTKTLDKLCKALDCTTTDILEYVPDEE